MKDVIFPIQGAIQLATSSVDWLFARLELSTCLRFGEQLREYSRELESRTICYLVFAGIFLTCKEEGLALIYHLL